MNLSLAKIMHYVPILLKFDNISRYYEQKNNCDQKKNKQKWYTSPISSFLMSSQIVSSSPFDDLLSITISIDACDTKPLDLSVKIHKNSIKNGSLQSKNRQFTIFRIR